MRLFIIGVLISAISGCGFTLRGSQPLPVSLQTLSVVSADNQDPLKKVLIRNLQQRQIVTSTESSVPKLMVNDGVLNRRLLSLFTTGQVAEYELIYSVTWQLWKPGDEAPQTFQFEILREYQDDPDQVLAKSRETNLILQEMRQQAAERILRTLASQN